MRDMTKLCHVIEEELRKIADKGLNTGNLDTAYKLVDMYKDLVEAEYREVKKEYYMDEGYSQSYHDDYSERRKRDSRGRYSRDDGMRYENGESLRRGNRMHDGGYSGYDRYMDSKHSYRNNKSPECKQRLMDTLEDYMDDFTQRMEEMMRDSDCAEERTTIKRYLDKIKNIT